MQKFVLPIRGRPNGMRHISNHIRVYPSVPERWDDDDGTRGRWGCGLSPAGRLSSRDGSCASESQEMEFKSKSEDHHKCEHILADLAGWSTIPPMHCT